MDIISLAASSWWYEIWNSLWLLICQGIYIVIGALYQVFEKVASVNIFSTEVFNTITGRLYIIIGIAMLFIFAYNLIMLIINPDTKKGSTSKMTKIVQESVTSVVLLILLPVIFNYLYVFQAHVLESNVIGQVILGNVGTTQEDTSKCDDDDYECKCDFSQFEELEQYNNVISSAFGLVRWNKQENKVTQLTNACKNFRSNKTPSQRGAYSIGPTILSAFYRPAHFNYNDCEEYFINGSSNVIESDEDKQICVNYYYDINYSKYTGNISAFSNDSYLKSIISDPQKDSMEFHWIMAVVGGLLAAYMFFQYAWQTGVRVAKLGFLQIISPIPVIMKIIPEQKMFDTWFKQLKDTYLELFIRLAIIYFSLFAISLVPDVLDTLWSSLTTGDENPFIKALTSVVVILGILQFAQEAPALFKEFFKGGSGKFGLKTPKTMWNENKYAKGTVGAVGTSSAILGKNLWDSAKKIKNGEGLEVVKNIPRAAGQQIMGAYKGFKKGEEAQSWMEMRDGVYSTAAAELQKPTTKMKLEDFFESEGTALKNHYTTDYSPFNSKTELEKAKRLEEVEAKQKAFEALLDNSDQVKGVEAYYEGLRKDLQEMKSGSMEIAGEVFDMSDAVRKQEAYKKLEEALKASKGVARGEAYDAKQNSEDVKAALEEYKTAIKKNITEVNNAMEKNGHAGVDGNPPITDVNVYLSDDQIINNYANTRNAGADSGKHAQMIKHQAIEEQNKAQGK